MAAENAHKRDMAEQKAKAAAYRLAEEAKATGGAAPS